MSDRVAEARAALDAIDAELVRLLAERSAVVASLAAHKAERGVPFRDPEREAAIFARVRALAAEAGLEPDAVEAVFRGIVGHRLGR